MLSTGDVHVLSIRNIEKLMDPSSYRADLLILTSGLGKVSCDMGVMSIEIV